MDGDQRHVVAVCAPLWRGVTAATESLFDHVVHLPRSADGHPDDLSDDELDVASRMLLECEARHVVLSGADIAQFRLAERLKRLDRTIRCDVLWHSTYVQLREDGQWTSFNAIIAAARSGLVTSVGVVKKGMDSLFRSMGCRSDFVMNFVPTVPVEPAPVDGDGIHVGIWPSNVNYTKLPHAMLAALVRLPDVTLHAAGFDERCCELVELLGLRAARLSQDLLPPGDLLDAMRRTHLTLSVTFAESCPMTPLQSFAVGVPCLLGPTSHLFEDDPYLRRTVIVPYPDRADVIATHIARAMAERGKIIAAYREFAPGYNAAAHRSVQQFLE
jgi:hypothetical protein